MPAITWTMSVKLIEEELTHSVLGCFFEVYTVLGFGFVEKIYLGALQVELRERGHLVQREVPVCVEYKGHVLSKHRIDMIVDQKLVIEVKSTFLLPPQSGRQLYNYLRVSNLSVGLVLHFGPEPKFYRHVCTRTHPGT